MSDLVLLIAAERAPADLVAELVDVVRRRCCPQGGEILVGCDAETSRLGVYVAGALVGAGGMRAAAPAGATPPKTKTRPPRNGKTSTPVGGGIVPDEWLAILRTLHTAGGEITNSSGRATAALRQALQIPDTKRDGWVLQKRIVRMETHHLLSRTMVGKMTKAIRLEPAGLAVLDVKEDHAEASTPPDPENNGGGVGAKRCRRRDAHELAGTRTRRRPSGSATRRCRERGVT